ncbi:MAG: DUF1573 domain-containing protein [Bacteroidia bacterium]|nr:DUF1573 domain-containing protein [Bacteroidia bacterium]MCF8446746.1 DUF1573 domain-containing protein [Bacteroidia bacterium]
MKKLFLLITLACFGLNGFSQTETNKENEPKPIIEFETTIHDFGTVYDGKPVQCDFIFINKGKVPLVLSNVQPGCGCTTPEWPREPIMPGQKGKITAIYNGGSYRGVFSKGITVQSNAANGSIQLTIKGKVEETPKAPQSPVKIDIGGGF